MANTQTAQATLNNVNLVLAFLEQSEDNSVPFTAQYDVIDLQYYGKENVVVAVLSNGSRQTLNSSELAQLVANIPTQTATIEEIVDAVLENTSIETLDEEVTTNVNRYNDMLVYDQISEIERNNWLGTLNAILQDSYLQYTRKGGTKVLISQQDNSYQFAHETIVAALEQNQQGIGTQISSDALYKLMRTLQRSSYRSNQQVGDLIAAVAKKEANPDHFVDNVRWQLNYEREGAGNDDYFHCIENVLSIVTGQ
jgi:predicted nucleic acid-binding protein